MIFSIDKFKCGLVNMVKKAWEDDIMALSSQLAYGLLFAFFPFIIFLMTIVGYSDIGTNDIMNNLKILIPREAYDLANKTISEVVNSKKGGLLSISIVLALWSASSGFNAVIKGLNKAYNEKESRSIIRVQLISLAFTFAMVIVVMLSVFMIIFGETNSYLLIKWFGLSNNFKIIWEFIKYIFSAAVMISVFSALYKFAPCKEHSIREVIPGALFASLGWIIASLSFSFYINNFGNYSRFYGSIGAVIVLMLWLFITAIVIILGGEINSVLLKNCK